jgi:hypothetical protein
MAAQAYPGLYKDDSPQAMIEADQARGCKLQSANRVTRTELILARLLAMKIVKGRWLDQGFKLQQITVADIASAAEVWFGQHRAELIEQAAGMVRSNPRLRKLAEREERDRLRSANVRSAAQHSKR